MTSPCITAFGSEVRIQSKFHTKPLGSRITHGIGCLIRPALPFALLDDTLGRLLVAVKKAVFL